MVNIALTTMKSTRLFLLFLLSVSFGWKGAVAQEQSSAEGLVIGAFAGPSFPSESLTDVYNLAQRPDDFASAYKLASSLGFHVGARARVGLTGALSLAGGITYQRFPGQVIVATTRNQQRLSIETNTNIIPIYLGLHCRIIQGIVNPYIAAHLAYTQQNTTISNGDSFVADLIAPGQQVEPSTTRLGAMGSAGLEINIIGLRPFIEFTYQLTNLAGAEQYEESKTLISLSVGVMF